MLRVGGAAAVPADQQAPAALPGPRDVRGQGGDGREVPGTEPPDGVAVILQGLREDPLRRRIAPITVCLLYTSDAADE